jgi:hypothetical protein
MQQSTSTNSDIIGKDVNKQICHAFGCSQHASKKINVDVGRFGTISLSLCENCSGKFVNSKEGGNSDYATR